MGGSLQTCKVAPPAQLVLVVDQVLDLVQEQDLVQDLVEDQVKDHQDICL